MHPFRAFFADFGLFPGFLGSGPKNPDKSQKTDEIRVFYSEALFVKRPPDQKIGYFHRKNPKKTDFLRKARKSKKTHPKSRKSGFFTRNPGPEKPGFCPKKGKSRKTQKVKFRAPENPGFWPFRQNRGGSSRLATHRKLTT